MDAAMKSMPNKRQGPSDPRVRGLESAYIDVNYEAPINNPPQQYPQAQMYQGYRQPPQSSRSNTMGSYGPSRHERRSSISSVSTSSVNMFMKKQWNRFNRSTTNQPKMKSHSGHLADDDDDKDEKEVQLNAADNIDVSFDDLQHIKGDRFGGVTDTTPYIPTILTKGNINSDNLNSEQYRKIQMANKKKRAMELANLNEKPDPNARSMSFNAYGQQYPPQQPNYPSIPGGPAYPPRNPQQMGYPPQNNHYNGPLYPQQIANRGYGYPPQQMGPRSMSLQSRGAPMPNSRAMSLQQQSRNPQGPPMGNGYPPPGAQRIPYPVPAPNRSVQPQPQPLQYMRPAIQSPFSSGLENSQQNNPYFASSNSIPSVVVSSDGLSEPQAEGTTPPAKSEVPKKKVQKIDFNDIDETPIDTGIKNFAVSPVKREDFATQPSQNGNLVYTRESMLSSVSNDTDFQTHNEKQREIYKQSNSTSATGNTLFYSARELPSFEEEQAENDATDADFTETTAVVELTNKAGVDQDKTLESLEFTNSPNVTQLPSVIAENKQHDSVDFNTYSGNLPLKSSVPAEQLTPKMREDDIFHAKSTRPNTMLPTIPIGKSLSSNGTPDIGKSQFEENKLTVSPLSVKSPITPASQRSIITFTPEQYGKVTDNDILLRELELVTSELASSVSRELTLEDTIRNHSSSNTSSPLSKSAITDNPETLLRNSGVVFNEDGGVSVGKELNSATSVEKGRVIMTLANQLAIERKKRYASEEILLEYETQNGLSKEHDNYVKDLKVRNQELENEISKLKDSILLEDTRKELLEVENESLRLEVADINRKYTQLKRQVIPRLQKQVEIFEDLLLKKNQPN